MRPRSAGLLLLALLALGQATTAAARLPDDYAPVRVPPAGTGGERRFDLRPAIEQARSAGKPLLIYFGAHDCPPCRVLEKSFAEHAGRLAGPIGARYTLVEIEGYLRGPPMRFVLPDGEYPLPALRTRVGDRAAGPFIWPTWWLLDNRRLISQRPLPAGKDEYLDPDWVVMHFGL